MSDVSVFIRRKDRRGKHLDESERYYIEVERAKKTAVRDIAESLNRPRETIYREIKRGSVTQVVGTSYGFEYHEVYCADTAQRRAEQEQSKKGGQLKIGMNYQLAEDLERWILQEKYSPYAALVALKNVDGYPDEELMCFKTVYNYVHELVLNITMNDLPMKGKQKKRKQKLYRRSHKNLKGKSIDVRPKEVNNRKEFGHWEGDLIIGKQGTKSVVLTLLERKTRNLIISRFTSKEAQNVVDCFDKLEARFGIRFSQIFKTITFDNGTEFSNFVEIELSRYKSRRGKSRTEVFYAHPYCSSERGSNENVNKMLRRFVPKSSNIGLIPDKKIAEAEKWINSYPRMKLRKEIGFDTAHDAFEHELNLLPAA